MVRQLVIISCCAIALSACGGSSGSVSTPTPPAAPFALISSSAADNANYVPRDGGVTFNFSNPLNPASVNAQSVTLTGPLGNAIPLDLAVSGSSLTAGGGVGLPGSTKFTLNLSTALTDAKGVALSSSHSKTFTTSPQTWQASPVVVATVPVLTAYPAPVLQADKSGNVMAVWNVEQWRGTSTFYSARLDAKTASWGAPQLLYRSAETEMFTNVRLTAAASGEFYMTWLQYSASANVSRMARYTPASGWSAPAEMRIAPSEYTHVYGQLAVASDGKVMALAQADGRVFATSYDPATGAWGTPQRIDVVLNSDNYILGGAIAADGKGNFIAAWGQQFNDGSRKPVAARYANGKWGSPQVIEGEVFGASPVPVSLSVNVAGQASLVWSTQSIGLGNSVMFSYYLPESDRWAEQQQVNPLPAAAPDNASDGTAVIDPAGNVTAVWSGNGLYARRFSIASKTWAAPQPLNVSWAAAPGTLNLVDSAGNVTILFVDGQLRSAQYLVIDGQWHGVALASAADSNFITGSGPAAAMDAGGVITLAWLAKRAEGTLQGGQMVVNRFK